MPADGSVLMTDQGFSSSIRLLSEFTFFQRQSKDLENSKLFIKTEKSGFFSRSSGKGFFGSIKETEFFEQRVARRWTRFPRSFASSLS